MRTKYKDTGLGTTDKQPPISVKFPPNIDQLLRSLPNRSDLIRRYVIEGLKRDGQLQE